MNWSAVLSREFVSFFGFLILLLFVKSNSKIGNRDKKRFYRVVVIGLVEIVAFEAELWTASLAEPTFLRVLLSVVGYSVRPILAYRLILLSDNAHFTGKRKTLLRVPAWFNFACVTTSFFSHACFWYNNANEFQRGPLGYVPHIVGALYMLLFGCVTCWQSKKSAADMLVAFSVSLFAIASMLLDTFLFSGGFIRVAIVLCTFFAYVQIQNQALLSLIDDIPGAIARLTVVNGMCRLVCFNEALCRAFDMSPEQFEAATNENVFLPLEEPYRAEAEKAMERLQRENSASFQLKLRTGGEEHWYNVALKAAHRTKSETDVYCAVLDMTKEKQMLDDLRMRSEEIALLMEQIGKDVCIFDVKRKMLTVTQRYAKVRGFAGTVVTVPEEVCAEQLISEASRSDYLAFYERIFAGEPSGSVIVKMTAPNSAPRWEKTDFVNILDENGKPGRAIISVEDITQSYEEKLRLESYRSAQKDLITRANYDMLTTVLTRSATMQAIEGCLSGEGKSSTHALIMMDLDNLKAVNDTLGHQIGDAALRDFAATIKAHFRSEDIIGRIGGDEFFVFAVNIDAQMLTERMQRLIDKLGRCYENGGKQATVTASAGIALYRGDEPCSLTELYAQADGALYRAKTAGKNRFAFADTTDAR